MVLDAAWLIPALPLAGFVVLLVFGRRLGDPWAGWLATAMTTAAFVVSIVMFASLFGRAADHRSFTQELFTWLPVGSLQVKAGLLELAALYDVDELVAVRQAVTLGDMVCDLLRRA